MNVKERYSGIQTVLKNCGEEGCHFLTLCSIIEEVIHKPLDLIEVIWFCKRQNIIEDDFYVNDGLKLLNYYTNKKWSRVETTITPTLKENEFLEVIYYNKKTELFHYRRKEFDTLSFSKTVKEGKVLKYYIWRHE